MTKINLRDFYPLYYSEDCFVEVTIEVEAELVAGRRYQKTHDQRVRRNKSFYSLDAEDGIEAAAVIHSPDNPEAVIDMVEEFCGLCRALNSLPEIQGRRIDAHYILGISQQEIAITEGVTKGSVSISITRGLQAMRKFLKEN